MSEERSYGPAQASALRRIGWIVDPDLDIDSELLGHTTEELKKYLGDRECLVEPIAIARRGTVSSLVRKFLNRGEVNDHPGKSLFRHFGERFKVLPARQFSDEIISDNTLSYFLSCYAELSHTDLLVVMEGTRRKLFQPLRRSFLSTLSMRSRVPVLIIGPRSQPSQRLTNILFPVIDPEKSLSSFEHVVEFAQVYGAKITILYRFVDETDGHWTPTQGPFGSVAFFSPLALQERNSKFRSLSTWAKLGRQSGVEIDVQLDNTASPFPECLLNFRKRVSADLIAIDPSLFESYYYEGALMETLRKSPCPLLISHPVGQSATEDLLREFETRLTPSTV